MSDERKEFFAFKKSMAILYHSANKENEIQYKLGIVETAHDKKPSFKHKVLN